MLITRIAEGTRQRGAEQKPQKIDADHERHDAVRPSFERGEARFGGHAFSPHHHDTYALGVTPARWRGLAA